MKKMNLILVALVMKVPAFASYTEVSHSHITIQPTSSAFEYSWIDFQIKDYQFERQYNSKSLFAGFFGLGWCSDLDIKLSEIKLSNSTLPKATLHNCFADSIISPKYSPQENAWYFENTKGKTYYFNENGLIKKILIKNTVIEIKWTAQNTPLSLTDTKNPIEISLNEFNQIKKLGSVFYKYDSEAQLISVNNQWKVKYLYGYDAYSNLSKISSKESRTLLIEYNNEEDSVVKIAASNASLL